MATITLSGCDPFDGVYDLDFETPFNTGELNIIKTISGVRAQELQDAFAAGDTDLIVALAVVAMHRVGKVTRKQAPHVAEVLWEAPANGIKFDVGSEADARPPERRPVDVESE